MYKCRTLLLHLLLQAVACVFVLSRKEVIILLTLFKDSNLSMTIQLAALP